MGRKTGCLSSQPTRRTLDVVVPPERAGSSRGDPTVHQNQLEPAGDALPVQVLQNQRAGPVLVGGGRHDQRAQRKAVTSTATMRLAPLVRP